MKITRVSLKWKLDELLFILPHAFVDENNACFTAIEAGWTYLNYPHVFFDENNACFTAIEVG